MDHPIWHAMFLSAKDGAILRGNPVGWPGATRRQRPRCCSQFREPLPEWRRRSRFSMPVDPPRRGDARYTTRPGSPGAQLLLDAPGVASDAPRHPSKVPGDAYPVLSSVNLSALWPEYRLDRSLKQRRNGEGQ